MYVEACMKMSRDAGSNPAASTHTGCTTRLDRNKARQSPLPGFVRLLPQCDLPTQSRTIRQLGRAFINAATPSRERPGQFAITKYLSDFNPCIVSRLLSVIPKQPLTVNSRKSESPAICSNPASVSLVQLSKYKFFNSVLFFK